MEGRLDTLSEFIEHCCLPELPFKALDTIRRIGSFMFRSTCHATHQFRFATAVKKLFNSSDIHDDRVELLNQILNLKLFNAYVPNPRGSWSGLAAVNWLDSTEARDTLKHTVTTHLTRLSPTDENDLFARVEKIIAQLDALSYQQPRESNGM
jgi:hypothetical protein